MISTSMLVGAKYIFYEFSFSVLL